MERHRTYQSYLANPQRPLFLRVTSNRLPQKLWPSRHIWYRFCWNNSQAARGNRMPPLAACRTEVCGWSSDGFLRFAAAVDAQSGFAGGPIEPGASAMEAG